MRIYPVLTVILDNSAKFDFENNLTTNIQLTAPKKCNNHPLDGHNINFLVEKTPI
jgi:hypothetical protein